jgi:CheY-like chemotaxis protein
MAYVRDPGKATDRRFVVLIADDEASVRASIKTILDPYPIDCVEAEDGLAAMELLETYRPHLLIVDYAMPGWDGVEVVRHLRGGDEDTRTKVIFISGYATLTVFDELIASRLVDGVLAKPFDARMLTYQVKMLLSVRDTGRSEPGGRHDPQHRVLDWGRMLGDLPPR